MAPKTGIFEGEPADTREAIMQATYRALSEHGYADLTIQRIGDEFEKSKSLLYHHYDSKDDLLVDFLAFMLEEMEDGVPIEETADAHGQLLMAFDHVFGELLSPSRTDFMRALVELRAQAAHDRTFRDRYTMNDRFLHGRLAEVIEEGIAEGTFNDVDADRVAAMLLTTIDGATLRHTTIEGADLDTVRAELDEYVRQRLLVDDE